jgi:dTDP-4-amino-4,6-dideoxygalactose transaminase
MKARRITVWPTLPLRVYARAPLEVLPFPLEEPASRLFSRARHGLYLGIKELGLQAGDMVLAPAYHHGSEIEALREAGLIPIFYDVDSNLEPEQGQLEELRTGGVKALYIVHYFGVPQDVSRWRSWCDEHGLFLIEDAAMAWLSSANGRPIGSFGDLAIFCLYKTFGLPDGGSLISARPPPRPDSKSDPCLKQVAIRHASWLAQRYRPVAHVHGFLSERSKSPSRLAPGMGMEFDLGDPNTSPCSSTVRLLPKIADMGAAERRRANFQLLRRELGETVAPLFSSLPSGASPVGFPIRVESDRQRDLVQILDHHGIVGARFWPEPHPSVPNSGYERSVWLRTNCLVLPVHQEVVEADLERTVHAVLLWANGTGR